MGKGSAAVDNLSPRYNEAPHSVLILDAYGFRLHLRLIRVEKEDVLGFISLHLAVSLGAFIVLKRLH